MYIYRERERERERKMTFIALSKNRSAGSSVMKGTGNHTMPEVFSYLSRVT